MDERIKRTPSLIKALHKVLPGEVCLAPELGHSEQVKVLADLGGFVTTHASLDASCSSFVVHCYQSARYHALNMTTSAGPGDERAKIQY